MPHKSTIVVPKSILVSNGTDVFLLAAHSSRKLLGLRLEGKGDGGRLELDLAGHKTSQVPKPNSRKSVNVVLLLSS